MIDNTSIFLNKIPEEKITYMGSPKRSNLLYNGISDITGVLDLDYSEQDESNANDSS